MASYQSKNLRRHYIAEHLTALGMTQRDLANAMHTQEKNVSTWINEPWRVNLAVLSDVADALDYADAGALLRPPSGQSARAILQAALKALPPDDDDDDEKP